MLVIGLLIGIYSYLILLLGVTSRLAFLPVILTTVYFSSFALLLIVFGSGKLEYKVPAFKKNEVLILVTVLILLFVNLIGAMGPELAFDSLWYHLTIPKLYLANYKVYFIDNGLFYYSAMPKLTEMLYAVALLFGNEILAKLMHFVFGLLTLIVIYRVGRIYLSRFYSLLAVLLFSSNLVVGWLSITAYTDLSRAFFESLALFCFLKFSKSSKIFDLVLSAIFVGFAISTKLLGIGSLAIFLLLIILEKSFSITQRLKYLLIFLIIAISIPLPWLFLAYLDTGNPIFPLFTHLGMRNFSLELVYPLNIVITYIKTFLLAPDPLSPIYLMIIPIILFRINKLFNTHKVLMLYVFLTYTLWYLTSQAGGTRFLVPYLPALSVLTMLAIKNITSKMTRKIFVILIIVTAFISIFYRGVANLKYLPVITGQSTGQQFLMDNLNFQFGDFYDQDQSIKKIVGDSKVLVINMHNLYYANFDFVLESWDENYKFVLIQKGVLPEKFRGARKVYENEITGVVLFKL